MMERLWDSFIKVELAAILRDFEKAGGTSAALLRNLRLAFMAGLTCGVVNFPQLSPAQVLEVEQEIREFVQRHDQERGDW